MILKNSTVNNREIELKKRFGDWYPLLKDYLWSKEYLKIGATLAEEYKQRKIICPAYDNIFDAFKLCKYKDLKVVIIGQDPYPQMYGSHYVANGLAFSYVPKTPQDYHIPASLKNIFKEIENDLGDGFLPQMWQRSTDLSDWAKQGVLLLNNSLTVEKEKPNSHSKIWKGFTEKIIEKINEKDTGIIFVLWGNDAKQYKDLVNPFNNYVLEAGHPSPLNTSVPFKGCKHFSQINEIIEKNNGKEFRIKWY